MCLRTGVRPAIGIRISAGAAVVLLLSSCAAPPPPATPDPPTSTPAVVIVVATRTTPTPIPPGRAEVPPTRFAPTATPEPLTGVVVGNTDGLGVYLRRTPELADRVRAYPDGTELLVLGSEVEAAGEAWLPVRTADGTEGWVPRRYTVPLLPTPTSAVPDQTAEPTVLIPVIPTATLRGSPTARPAREPPPSTTPAPFPTPSLGIPLPPIVRTIGPTATPPSQPRAMPTATRTGS
jgi:hypothetical protein